MLVLSLGLLLFLGVHSVKIVAPIFREQSILLWGENIWKGVYSAISSVGLLLMIIGYWSAREEAVEPYEALVWSRMLLMCSMPIALVLFVASQLPTGRIKHGTRHPMMIGMAIWSIGYLIANGDLPSVILFGGFSIWAIFQLRSAFLRPSVFSKRPTLWPDVTALVVGPLLYWIFVVFLHLQLFGVQVSL